jgi:hypothetical protein
MSKRYTFAKEISTPDGKETFSAVEFDSFDEARKAVDKAVYERKLELNPGKPSSTTKKEENIIPPTQKEGTHSPEIGH